MMISTITTTTTLGWFIPVFILIAPDGIFCLSTTYVEGGTSIRLSCKHDVPDHEFHRVKWFKSTNDRVYENGPSALVSWDNTSDPIITDDNYGIDKDFSLVIHSTSFREEGLYRCYVTRNIPGDFEHYDVKVISYGKVKPAHTSQVQYGTHFRIPCSYNSTRASSQVSVLWYKRESRDCFKSDDQLIASSIDGRLHVSAGYTLNKDFSLEIQSVSSKYEAVYRSIVVSTQETRPSASDTKVKVYAPPREVPVIRYSFENGSCLINCSVDHVYPLQFPEFSESSQLNFLSNNQTRGIPNKDGTFNTSIEGNVIHPGHTITVECTFPHFGYKINSSKHIVNLSVKDEVPHPPGSSNHNPATIAILTALGITMLIILVNAFAVYAWKRRIKKHQQNDVDKSLPEIEPMV